MKTQRFWSRVAGISVALFIAIFVLTDIAEARGSRSGGGSSFGGSRKSSPSSAQRSQPKQTTPKAQTPVARQQTATTPKSSFGGKRLSSGQEYKKSYGVPRKTEPVSVPGASSPYVVNRYGGMSDGFMMGYLMGTTSMMWSMPFHPAFYYSRPYYAVGPDGTTEVYPPRISWTTVFLTMLIVGGIIYLIVRVVRKRREQAAGSAMSSFS